MIYLRFQVKGQEKYGILQNKTVYEITPDYFGPFRKTGRKYALGAVQLLPPCLPGKIIAMGLNYLDHARELKMPMPLQPLMFLKAPSAVIGSGEPIQYPAVSHRIDYEAELAIVMKTRARAIPPRKAFDHILGYTCFNDVTARDLQSTDEQWARSKSFDTFAPIGPWIVDGIDPHRLSIETRLNGKVKQQSNTNDLIFKIDEIVAFVSQVMTLNPGDVIATGTPSGIGPMNPGDTVKIKIQKIGTLSNKVV